MAPRRTTRSTTDQETINAIAVTNAQLQAMIDQGVTAALAARDALRSTNGDDSHNSETGVRRTERANRECTYIDFLKCQPLPFKGTKGVASLSQWCEKMESVFHISNCAAENQKQMAPRRTTRSTADQETIDATMVTNAQLQAMIDQGVTAALAARDALRSTNGDDSHNSGTGVRRTERATHECTYTDFLKCQPYLSKAPKELPTVGHEAAYGMTWKTLMKMMTEKYCPRNEIRKLEMKLWDLKVKGTDLASYTQRYQELALLCGRMFSKESDKIEKYVGGLPDMIHGSVVASKPKTMQEAIEIATELTDKKIRTFAEHETPSKRKFENTSRNTQNQQQQHSNKRQNTG
nr:hypothetical protein [Tanacetum cinerariifolium]